MSREYDQLAWVDFPERLTPLSAANLNRMENGIANLYTDRNKMENNIAYVEEGEEATRHYFINSYLMLNGIFYKTVSEINVGDLLDYGLDGNIEHVDISSQFGSGGGGSTGCVELTQAQYDALSDEAKMLDVIYLITDSPDNYLDEVFGDFATVEYTDTASKAYAVGDYLVYDSKFYKVTAAIAQGDTIVPDTNVDEVKVGDEIKNLENGSLIYRGYVASDGDLDNYENPGIYYIGSVVPAHTPTSDQYAAVIVTRSNWPTQIVIYADANVYIRTKTGNPQLWGSWFNIPTKTTSTEIAYASAFRAYVYASNPSHCYVQRYGKLVIVTGCFYIETDVPANTLMLASNFRPITQAFAPIVSSAGNISRLKFEPNGNLVNENVLAHAQWWNYQIIFIES